MALSLTDRRQVGATALSLPTFGFGGSAVANHHSILDEADVQAAFSKAWERGIRYYDTAAWYGRGLSEHRMGGFLRNRPRREFILTTKVGRTLRRPANPAMFDTSPWVGGLKFDVRFDYTRDGILHSYGQALQRLSLDTVDALLVHDLDVLHHGDATAGHLRDLEVSGMSALSELKAAGDIKAIGMGINDAAGLSDIASRVDLDFVLVALPYTLADQSALHAGLKRCIERNISVIIGAPFASGILATGAVPDAKYKYRPAPPDILAKVSCIEKVCAAHNVALPAAALQFPLAHPAVVSVITGMLAPAQVDQNIDHLTAPIPNAFWSDLKTEGLIDPEAPTP
jgi:D-threo-aldose 1-dehydrogenase